MRKSKPGNAIYLEVGIWYDEARDSIHIASNDVPDLHTTVHADERRKRGHPNVFKKLAKVLRDGGAPAPQEAPSDSWRPEGAEASR